MLSVETQQKILQLEAAQNNYMPSSEVVAQLGQKVIIMLVGPSCIGKSTLMQAVTQRDDRFSITGSFTSRPPRLDDSGKTYDYIEHIDTELTQLFTQIGQGQVVNYAVHPTTKYVYGSYISQYAKEFNMLDTLASSVEGFRRIPFKECPVVGMAAEPAHWLGWFDSRFPNGHPDRLKRRDEAIQSLEWLIAEPQDMLHWVINAPDGLERAAEQVIAIATHQSPGDEAGRSVAEAMLAAAKDIGA